MSEALPQSYAVEQIEDRFDPEMFTYENRNGNRAIKPAVLSEFRRISEGSVVWSKSERTWRKLRTQPGRRLIL